jgi:hypothetical protein
MCDFESAFAKRESGMGASPKKQIDKRTESLVSHLAVSQLCVARKLAVS